jgi:MFS family permease
MHWLFCLTTILYWFSLYTYVPILPVYASSLGASYKMVGFIIGAYGVTQLLLRIPQGVLSDKWRKRKIFVVAAMAASAISACGMFLFPNVTALLIFRALSGVSATAWVIIVVLFASYFSAKDAPKAYGIMNSIGFAGQMAGMFAGGIIAEVWGWPSTFLLAAAGAGLGLLLSLVIQENVPKAESSLRFSQIPGIVRNYHVLLAAILAILVQLVVYGTVFGFVPVAARNLGATNFELGLLTTLSTLPSIIASMLAGTLFVQKLGLKVTLCSGFLLLAISAAAIPFLDNMIQLYGFQFIGGFGRGLVFPLLMALSVKSVHEEVKATAMGIFQSLYAFGMFAGPVIVGVAADVAGLNMGFWLCALSGLLGVGIAFHYAEDRPSV